MSIALTIVASSSAAAQTNCQVTPASVITPRDVCQKIVDLFTFLAPQIGVALSGGNPMPGEGGSLGGPGKGSMVVHVTVVDGSIPKNPVPVSLGSTAISSDFGRQRAPIPMPAVDAALGIFRGYPMGLTNVGGIDLLLGATYVPDVNKEHFGISTDGSSLAFAYGVRVGVIQESAVAPGISVSYKHRKLPTSTFLYRTGDDTLSVHGLAMTSNSYRLTAAKHFVFVGIGGGIGRDMITSISAFTATVNEPTPGGRSSVDIPASTQKVTRSTAFANMSFGLPKAQLTLELGWSSKGDAQNIVNTFDGHSANEGYRYGSIGFGFRL